MDQSVTPRRRFTLRDISILVAAIAVGFWLGRVFLLNAQSFQGKWGSWRVASHMVLMTAQLGLLALSWLPPRSRMRRLARQPGFLAGVAVASVVVSETIGALRSYEPGSATWLHNYLVSLSAPSDMAHVILLVWLVGILQGLDWRRSDWVESAARLIAVIWVLDWGFFLVRKLIV